MKITCHTTISGETNANPALCLCFDGRADVGGVVGPVELVIVRRA